MSQQFLIDTRYRSAPVAQPLHTDYSYVSLPGNVQFLYGAAWPTGLLRPRQGEPVLTQRHVDAASPCPPARACPGTQP